ncbi:uncharacterized protein TrAFT101_001226 [Trichoderma asperellum]|uniref:uncharacterized protein n=1 Tax=Trichoderma asperellum TaxID=101201 RepID=UPI00331858DE|nr:hypothetical protein TrAFT101_001226 [Trichoderma asperellum]
MVQATDRRLCIDNHCSPAAAIFGSHFLAYLYRRCVIGAAGSLALGWCGSTTGAAPRHKAPPSRAPPSSAFWLVFSPKPSHRPPSIRSASRPSPAQKPPTAGPFCLIACLAVRLRLRGRPTRLADPCRNGRRF